MIPVNTDLTQEVLDKLPNQFYNKKNIIALLSTWGGSLQEKNDEIFNIVNTVNITDAEGYLLDCVGSYVAVLRNKDDDDTYRSRIKRKILAASSGGTPNNLLEALAFATNGETKIWEHFPVSCSLSTNGTLFPENLTDFLQDASPAASGNIIVYSNPFNNCFIPSELGSETLKLVDHNLYKFYTDYTPTGGTLLELTTPLTPTTDMDQFVPLPEDITYLTVNNLLYGSGDDSVFALLSEFTRALGSGTEKSIPDNLGILCEIHYTDGGIVTADYDYLILDNVISEWYNMMNYYVPTSFS